jgi:hypothetical protein
VGANLPVGESQAEVCFRHSSLIAPRRLNRKAARSYLVKGYYSRFTRMTTSFKDAGDFRNRNEPERYKKAFDRLLCDLKAEEKTSSS